MSDTDSTNCFMLFVEDFDVTDIKTAKKTTSFCLIVVFTGVVEVHVNLTLQRRMSEPQAYVYGV